MILSFFSSKMSLLTNIQNSDDNDILVEFNVRFLIVLQCCQGHHVGHHVVGVHDRNHPSMSQGYCELREKNWFDLIETYKCWPGITSANFCLFITSSSSSITFSTFVNRRSWSSMVHFKYQWYELTIYTFSIMSRRTSLWNLWTFWPDWSFQCCRYDFRW